MPELASPLLTSAPRRALAAAAAPDVEIVVPVYNEAAGLEHSIRRLHRFLSDGFPFSWRIVIADNASVDATPDIARRLALTLPSVRHLRLEQKGRGRALRAAWSASAAKVVTYMDVDLSTDLRGLLPLVAPLMSGHSDLAIGTRLAHSSRVVRGPKREFISRGYNRILRTVLRAKFTDAQCGFKAVRRDVLDPLMGDVKDQGWFFDTELLVLAQRRGLRIHEVPVDWVDDPDSRVDIVHTAITDLKGVARLLAGGPIATFMGIGVLSTIAYALLYLGLAPLLGALGANAAALAITAVANTAANRRLTFGVTGQGGPRPPPRARRAGVRPHARAHQRRARRPARPRPEPVAGDAARRADRRVADGDGDPLRRDAHVGVHPRSAARSAPPSTS